MRTPPSNLAVVVLSAFLTLGSAGLATAQSPSPSASAAVEASEAATQPTLTWTRVSEAEKFDPGNTLFGITTLPSGEAVIVGAHGSTGKAWSWHSSDGLDWEFVPMPGVEDGAAFDVTTWGDGLIAVGRSETGGEDLFLLSGVVWTSADGTGWTEPVAVEDATFQDVLVTSDGLAVAGATMTNEGQEAVPTVWTSTDAVNWEPTLIGDKVEFVAETQLVRSPAGVWLVNGRVFTPEAVESRLWRSEDGAAWERLDLPGGTPDAWVAAIEPTPTGFLLASNVGVGVPADTIGTVWSSSDGLVWDAVASIDRLVTSFASGPSGYLAFTSPPPDWEKDVLPEVAPIVLSSPDGLSWTEAEVAEFDQASVGAATTMPDGRVLAVGSVPGVDFLSSLPLTWLGVPGAADGSE